ncbi:MAG: hypothetical protein IJG38_07645 [Thermoguttaceae bacterium]|nr:hypothetical protein [Thermoguttaceae bacterium]
MNEIITRKEKIRWSDILISQKSSDTWTYENAKMAGPSSLAARPLSQSVQIGGSWSVGVPEIYTLQMGGTWAADETVKITLDGVEWKTFTAKANPSTASQQFSAGGTGAVIAAEIMEYAATAQPTNWTVSQKDDTLTFTYNGAATGKYITITVDSSAGTATLANTQNGTVGDTITISGTTYTCKENPSTSSGTTEFGADYTPAQIAKVIVDDPLTISNFTITQSGDKVVITQSTAGTGTALTSSDVSVVSAGGTAVLKTEQTYRAEISSGDELKYELVPGDPVYLVSTDSKGEKTVAPINALSSDNISAFVGFVCDAGTVETGKTETLRIATDACRLDVNLLPTRDAFGNVIDWTVASGTVGKAASDKGFKFGEEVAK